LAQLEQLVELFVVCLRGLISHGARVYVFVAGARPAPALARLAGFTCI
jgi:hypothetical protein